MKKYTKLQLNRLTMMLINSMLLCIYLIGFIYNPSMSWAFLTGLIVGILFISILDYYLLNMLEKISDRWENFAIKISKDYSKHLDKDIGKLKEENEGIIKKIRKKLN